MRWLSQASILAMLALTLGALGAACGDGEELTAAQYFERADMALDGATERLRLLSADYEHKMATEEIDSVDAEMELTRERDEAFLSILRDVRHEIGGLRPAAEVKSAHKGYVDALEGLIEAYEELHSSDAYDDYLRDFANSDIRGRLEEAEMAEEIDELLAELREIAPADTGIQKAHAALEQACRDLRDAAVASKVGIELPCDF